MSGRGISALQPLLLGWTSLAMTKLVPGGAGRVRRELRALVSSYDATHLGAAPLERLAAAGFPDVAAAVAARCACGCVMLRKARPSNSPVMPAGTCSPSFWQGALPGILCDCSTTYTTRAPFCSSDSPAITLAHKAVFQAAAGDWQPLLLMVLQEWEQSTFHPGCVPPACMCWCQVAASTMQQGPLPLPSPGMQSSCISPPAQLQRPPGLSTHFVPFNLLCVQAAPSQQPAVCKDGGPGPVLPAVRPVPRRAAPAGGGGRAQRAAGALRVPGRLPGADGASARGKDGGGDGCLVPVGAVQASRQLPGRSLCARCFNRLAAPRTTR